MPFFSSNAIVQPSPRESCWVLCTTRSFPESSDSDIAVFLRRTASTRAFCSSAKASDASLPTDVRGLPPDSESVSRLPSMSPAADALATARAITLACFDLRTASVSSTAIMFASPIGIDNLPSVLPADLRTLFTLSRRAFFSSLDIVSPASLRQLDKVIQIYLGIIYI